MNSEEYFKKRDDMLALEKMKKLPSIDAINAILNFIQNLFTEFLKKFDENIVASIPTNKIMLLETSNIPRLDEIMNVTPVSYFLIKF